MRQTLRGRDGEKFGKSIDGDGTYVVKAATVDVDAALEAARRHTYPGHPTQVAPFESLAVMAILRPLVRTARR